MCDTLGHGINDTVPDPFVPIFVATGDAWFPRQRDIDGVIDDLPADGTLTDTQREALIQYLTTVRISPRNAKHVERALEESPVADAVDPEELQVNELPEIPDGIDLGPESTTEDGSETSSQHTSQSTTDSGAGTVDGASTSPSDADSDAIEETEICTIPGIGPHRAEKLLEGGYANVDHIADSRPSDVADATGLNIQMATVAVEGAREITGYERPTADRLASETGGEKDRFTGPLSSLAASGTPPSEAAPVLRLLYGPSLVDIESVSGQQAYYLWEAGYQTPFDVATATVEELCDVPYIGQTTGTAIREDAQKLIECER
ncbi:helix-hairpin-helix domain-containing protein [Natronorubrum sp. DTA7]|uniref:helix-hairpin-helix domain-containing protein n=1 Tax=Natronorubrum sp. DTA7 TaxID=3447016 RepID=UPI003F877C42